jgi:small multidrug resistance pump
MLKFFRSYVNTITIYNFFTWSSLVGFNICLAQIEVSVAYAIWSAFGTCLVAVVGIVFFNESCDAGKIACLGLITAGVVGLNLRDDGGGHA